ncbi:hypothetical protein Mgra_00005117 [Meloidogyne graminicola]|uniref:Uncharacterized protein n=1 Tax=Meloidogyne graminicola TaxID=189291 RepID=A0A8S9ZPT0_9BILA|nr:hypothetical protein Mgra_00005117 [Meloidogyne graminicola]
MSHLCKNDLFNMASHENCKKKSRENIYFHVKIKSSNLCVDRVCLKSKNCMFSDKFLCVKNYNCKLNYLNIFTIATCFFLNHKHMFVCFV